MKRLLTSCLGAPYSDDGSLMTENHPLMIMVTSKRSDLLDHPLVSALLKRKWTGIGLIVSILNFLLYAVFLAMLTGFTLTIGAPYQFNNTSYSNISDCQEFADQQIPALASFSKYGILVMAPTELIIEIAEIRQMYSFRVWKYFKKLENLCEWITCIAAIIFVIDTNDCHDTGFRPEWQWTFGTISVFLAWINLLVLLQKFEWIGLYVVMLYRIAREFTKFFLVFSLLIVAFAMVFHCLFQNQDQFSTIQIALVKTTSMMIGDTDFGTIFFDGNVHYDIISFVFFYIFMLLMTIVVINLLVALAVDNIQEFKKNANIEKKRMQVEFALGLERLSISMSNLYWKIKRKPKVINFDKYFETIIPSHQTWLEAKWAKLWNLTERDIQSGLQDEKEYTSIDFADIDFRFSSFEKRMKKRIQMGRKISEVEL